jgi:drug/metabolite transporter (DMT)-like permease
MAHPEGPSFTAATGIRFLAQALIWGSSFSFIREATRSFSPGALVLSRLALATVVLVAVCRFRGEGLVEGRRAWAATAGGAVLANVAPYLLLTYGERTTTAGIAGVLIGATPLLTVLVAAVALRAEGISLPMVAGFVIGFAGIILVVDPFAGADGTISGAGMCLAAAACYAAGYVWARRFQTGTGTPLGVAASQLLAATVIEALVTPITGCHTGAFTSSSVTAVLILGLLGTGYGTILYFRLITDVGPSLASAVDYLVPVFAVMFGVILTGEHVAPLMLGGMVLILLGMGLGEGHLSTQLKRLWSGLDPRRPDGAGKLVGRSPRWVVDRGSPPSSNSRSSARAHDR